jgi:DNA polymerase/3'-5' exonuclease PolX
MIDALPTLQRPRFAADYAQAVAQDFIDALQDHCEQICIAGSLRRQKPAVKDVEILFVPKFSPAKKDDFFQAPLPFNLAEQTISDLLRLGLIAKRPNLFGGEAWGAKNKLGIHVPSGIPVDLFTATRANFFNYLVCRTGGAKSNIRICEAAIARGWKWNPYGTGFSQPNVEGRLDHPVTSEREVFEFVGLPYLEPWER